MAYRGIIGLLVLCAACSDNGASGADFAGGRSNDGDGGSGALVDGGAPVLFTDGGGGGSASGCASGVGRFIYVISDANDLYTFDPTLFPSPGAIALVGPVTCDTSGVNSMAVDRAGTAWVNFNDGRIYRVTTTAPIRCTPTSFVPGQGGFSKDLGMGFSVDAPGSSDETLYVSDNGGPGGDCKAKAPGSGCMGKGLGKLDLGTMTLSPLGPYTGGAAGYNAELTGTGDGKLYGFFTTSPGAYGPIDKTSGATSAPAPTPVPSVNASTGGYAFSFWGGDFYFYTAPSNGTIVTRLQTSTGATTKSPELGFTIVGAGVSTCAPTAPPK